MGKSGKSFKEKCEDAGVNYKSACNRVKNHPKQTEEEIIETLVQFKSRVTIKEKCEQLGVKYTSVIHLRHKFKNKTLDEIIEIVKENNSTKSLQQLFRENNLLHEYDNAISFRSRHSDYSNTDILQMYINKGNRKEVIDTNKLIEKSFRQKCIDNELDYNRVYIFRYNQNKRGNNISEDESIELFKLREENKVETFSEKCRRFGLDVKKTTDFRYYHSELSDEQVIIHYRPDLYINCLGELVEDNS